jgi:cell division protein FtsW
MAKHASIPLLIAVCLLVALGLTMLASTGYFVEEGRGEDYFTLRKQLVGLSLGTLGCIVFALLDYNVLLRWRWYLFAIATVTLAVIYIPGVGVKINGATRWLSFGGVRLQPSELAKIALAISLAAWFSIHELKTKTLLHGFIIPGFIATLIVGLIGGEVDLGNALLASLIASGIMFVAGTRLIYLGLTGALIAGALYAAVLYTPNRMQRIIAVYDLEHYKETWGLQQWVSKLAIGSGGIQGQGLGASRMKLYYLPEAHTDFVFPILGEELGLYGTAGTVLMFVLIVVTGMCISSYAPNRFGKLLGFAITLMLGLEALLNMGVTTALLPNKGLPLPFVSYGSSSLIAAMVAVGILINIHRQGVHLTREELPVIRKNRRWTPQL